MSRLVGASMLAVLFLAACGSQTPSSPTPLTPPADPRTANVYILPGAVALAAGAFGDEAVVIYRQERMRWRNIDPVEHNLVADRASVPEFVTTGALAPGAERSFTMNSIGRTTIHCTIHPQMTALIVRDR